MKQRVDIPIYKGMNINKDLLVTFHVTLDTSGQFATVARKTNSFVFHQAFSLSISEGYQKPRIFCPANQWQCLVSLLRKSIKLIQDNIYSIFPSLGNINWDDVDKKGLERFQTEKSMYLNGFTIIPIIYYASDCNYYPGINITTKNNESVQIPLEDAILISEILDSIEPNALSISYLKIIDRLFNEN